MTRNRALEKRRERALAKAGFIAVRGWIRKEDRKAFDRLTAKAEADVRRLTEEKKDE